MSKSVRIALITGFSAVLTLMLSAATAGAADIAHGHDCATASPIAANSDTRAVLFDSTDFAVYRMVLDQRGLIDVWTDPGTFSVWDVDLLDSSCQVIQGVQPGKSLITGEYSKISVPSFNIKPLDNVWTLPAGVYFIRLHPDPVLQGGEPFVFHTKFVAHYGHDCATAEALPASGSIDGALLSLGDREVFRVAINPPARIHAWTTGPLGRWNQPDINLHFSDCSRASEMELNDETPTGILTVPLEVGTYYLSVEPFKQDFLGSFTLHFEFVNNNENW
jgi:hypothetical protein